MENIQQFRKEKSLYLSEEVVNYKTLYFIIEPFHFSVCASMSEKIQYFIFVFVQHFDGFLKFFYVPDCFVPFCSVRI
jgi:hypothetical protein